jgi:hypothetical protein
MDDIGRDALSPDAHASVQMSATSPVMTRGAAESTRVQQLRRPRVEEPSAKRRPAE